MKRRERYNDENEYKKKQTSWNKGQKWKRKSENWTQIFMCYVKVVRAYKYSEASVNVNRRIPIFRMNALFQI